MPSNEADRIQAQAEADGELLPDNESTVQYDSESIRLLKLDEARLLASTHFEEPEGFRFGKGTRDEMHEFLITNVETLNALLRGDNMDVGIPGTSAPEDQSETIQPLAEEDESDQSLDGPDPTTDLG